MNKEKIETQLMDVLEIYFPKGKSKERGKVLLIIALAQQLGVAGVYEKMKEDKLI